MSNFQSQLIAAARELPKIRAWERQIAKAKAAKASTKK
jgi:hypothetical protein